MVPAKKILNENFVCQSKQVKNQIDKKTKQILKYWTYEEFVKMHLSMCVKNFTIILRYFRRL